MEKILLAEDEEILRKLYRIMINENFPNYEIEAFTNGVSLVERLEKDVTGVRLILTDNSMPPGPAGSEIIQRYARDTRFKDIPFVLTYAGKEEIGMKAVENGAFAVLPKPFGIVPFIDLLQKAVDKT